jgi:hypothetical protein
MLQPEVTALHRWEAEGGSVADSRTDQSVVPIMTGVPAADDRLPLLAG